MFAHALATLVLALPVLAAASVVPRGDNQCNTGPIQCCDSVQKATPQVASTLSALLGIDVEQITGLVGLICSPISVIGAGGNSCTQQPVCCENNSFNGVVAIGCTPININV